MGDRRQDLVIARAGPCPATLCRAPESIGNGAMLWPLPWLTNLRSWPPCVALRHREPQCRSANSEICLTERETNRLPRLTGARSSSSPPSSQVDGRRSGRSLPPAHPTPEPKKSGRAGRRPTKDASDLWQNKFLTFVLQSRSTTACSRSGLRWSVGWPSPRVGRWSDSFPSSSQRSAFLRHDSVCHGSADGHIGAVSTRRVRSGGGSGKGAVELGRGPVSGAVNSAELECWLKGRGC